MDLNIGDVISINVESQPTYTNGETVVYITNVVVEHVVRDEQWRPSTVKTVIRCSRADVAGIAAAIK